MEAFYKFPKILNLDLDPGSMNRDCSELKVPGTRQVTAEYGAPLEVRLKVSTLSAADYNKNLFVD
jgi:hypothetical protein